MPGDNRAGKVLRGLLPNVTSVILPMDEHPINSQPTSYDESETQIIGVLLRKPGFADRILGTLDPDCFHDPAKRIVYETLDEMHEEETALDAVLLHSRLKESGRLNGTIGVSASGFLADLGINTTEHALADSNVVESHMQILRDAKAYRKLFAHGRSAANHATNGADTREDLEADIAAINLAASELGIGRGKSSDTPPQKPFPVKCFPEPIRRLIEEGQKAIGCDASYFALPMLCALAQAIGNRRVISPKSGWKEPAIFWCANVGISGTAKSPAAAVVLRFLKEEQRKEKRFYDNALEDFEREQVQYKQDLSDWKRSGGSGEIPLAPKVPQMVTLLTSDSTVEVLAKKFSSQIDGVFYRVDELKAWLGSFNQYKSSGTDESIYLSMWQGEEVHKERVSGDNKVIHADRGSLNVYGGIQPGLLRNELTTDRIESGLIARLLLSMPDDSQIRWSDDVVSDAAIAQSNRVFDRLLTLKADEFDQPRVLTLTTDAQELFKLAFNKQRERLENSPPILRAAYAKLISYTLRIALVLQLAESVTHGDDPTEVTLRTLEAAIEMAEWFAEETKRIYQVMGITEAGYVSEREQHMHEAIKWMRQKGGTVTERELSRGPRYCRQTGKAHEISVEMVRRGWAKSKSVGERGRTRQLTLTTKAPR